MTWSVSPMAFKLTDKDHNKLDAFLNSFLDAYKSGKISLSQAREGLAHVMTAGVIDNEGEFRAWLDMDPEEVYKDA